MAVRDRGLAQLGLLALFAGLATLHTWPMLSDPARLTRLDNDDTTLNTWIVAWVAHQLARAPWRLFDAPIFHPAPDALACSEHLFVQSLMGAPLLWAGASPVLVYNLLAWAGYALSGCAMALLLRAWTGSTAAGVVAGCLYAFNAHLLTRYAHLQALHVQFFPAVLYALDRVLRASASRAAGPHSALVAPRALVLLAAALALQSLTSHYTMLMMGTAVAVAVIVRPEAWRRSPRLWLSLAAAAAAAALVVLPFVLPYTRVRSEQGMVRTLDELARYSAGGLDYLVTAGRLHYTWWSHRFFEGRTALFPGAIAAALAALSLGTGLAWKDTRARMALAFGVMGVVLSFGPSLPGYAWLHEHVLIFEVIRAPARWGFFALVSIAMLAGFAVADVGRRFGTRWWWPAFVVAVAGGVTLEALRAPIPMTRFDGIPAVHDVLARDDVRAVAVLPVHAGERFHRNAEYLLHQTRHWKPMINGYSGFLPSSFERLAGALQAFPDAPALEALRATGVSHVVVHRAPMERQLGADGMEALGSHADLALVVEQDGVIVFRVR